MQPAQLSLLPQQCPTPPQIMVAHLPEPEIAEAIRLLAGLIAKAVTSEKERVAGDE
jgi:hypothetical protein